MHTKRRRIGSLSLLAATAVATVLLISQMQSQSSTFDKAVGTPATVGSDIAITSPVGGERFRAGEKRTIRWHGQPGIEAVDIALWDGHENEWRKVAANIPVSNGKVEWLVPHDLEGTRYRIKVTNHENSDQYWMSSDYFHIVSTSTSPSSINEQDGKNLRHQSEKSISVTPMPADENVEIHLPVGYVATQVHIVDALGERVMEVEVGAKAPTLSVSTARLPSGSYLLIAEDDLGTPLSCRLIVRH